MKSLAGVAVAATIMLAGTGAQAGYGPGAYYGFTSAYVGAIAPGYTVQPLFGAFAPTLTGMTVNVAVPLGRHSARWWRVFTILESRQIAALFAKAPVIGGGTGGAGSGVPGPVAGAGIPALLAAGAYLMRRRRGCGLPLAA